MSHAPNVRQFRRFAKRIGHISRHVVAGGDNDDDAVAVEPREGEFVNVATEAEAPGTAIQVDSDREQLRERLKNEPRISKDLSTWTETELMQRSLALGAEDAAVNAALASSQTKEMLIELCESLEPPSPQTATVEMITVENTASFEEMAAILEGVGALIIKNAADEETIAAVDAQLDAAGAWEISRNKKGRMQMDMLLKAPATRKLLTNEYVLGVTRHVLGPSCKRIALKELSVFEVQPGQEKQKFHREDMFWPWHHEPHPWSTNILWAIDDFTPENGGTNVVPYSHRSTAYMRENGREMVDGNYDPADILRCAMPRGSVLLFTGGLMHGSGENETDAGRKSLLSSYQLGWLRPEYKFWAHRELHDALSNGEIEPELTELMGHHNNQNPGDEIWAGNRNEGMYNGRAVASVEAGLEGVELARPGLMGRNGYETGGSGGMGSAPAVENAGKTETADGGNSGNHKSAK